MSALTLTLRPVDIYLIEKIGGEKGDGLDVLLGLFDRYINAKEDIGNDLYLEIVRNRILHAKTPEFTRFPFYRFYSKSVRVETLQLIERSPKPRNLIVKRATDALLIFERFDLIRFERSSAEGYSSRFIPKGQVRTQQSKIFEEDIADIESLYGDLNYGLRVLIKAYLELIIDNRPDRFYYALGKRVDEIDHFNFERYFRARHLSDRQTRNIKLTDTEQLLIRNRIGGGNYDTGINLLAGFLRDFHHMRYRAHAYGSSEHTGSYSAMPDRILSSSKIYKLFGDKGRG